MPSQPTERRTLVFAGNYREFAHWCRENGRNPHDRNLIYASEWYRLQGLSDIDVVYYGTYYLRRDYDKIMEAIHWIGRRSKSAQG
jgi:hypothetical protein